MRFLTSILNRILADSTSFSLTKKKTQPIPGYERNIFSKKTTTSEQQLTSLSWKTNICIFYKNNIILEILFPRKPVDPITNMFSLRKPRTFNAIDCILKNMSSEKYSQLLWIWPREYL